MPAGGVSSREAGGLASSPCSCLLTTWLEHGQLSFWGPYSTIHLVCGVPRKMQGCGGAVALRAIQFRCQGSNVAGCHKLKFAPGNATQGNSPQGEKLPVRSTTCQPPVPDTRRASRGRQSDWVQPSQTTPGLLCHRNPMRTAVLTAERLRGKRPSRCQCPSRCHATALPTCGGQYSVDSPGEAQRGSIARLLGFKSRLRHELCMTLGKSLHLCALQSSFSSV